MERQIAVPGDLRPKEAGFLANVITRMGYTSSEDPNTGLVTLKRAPIVTKPEFREATEKSGVDTSYFGALAWNRLRWLGQVRSLKEQRDGAYPELPDDIPTEFRKVGYSGKMAIVLTAESLEPTIVWVHQNREAVDRFSIINDRTIHTWEAVAEAFPQPDKLDLDN